jgi:hypothetical protein
VLLLLLCCVMFLGLFLFLFLRKSVHIHELDAPGCSRGFSRATFISSTALLC